MKKLIFTIVCALFVVSNLFATSSSDKFVSYNGQNFEISVFNQKEAEKEIAEARKVYAFCVSPVSLNIRNSSEDFMCYFNSATQEYAVEIRVKIEEKVKVDYIIFSERGAKMVETLPSGFDFADVNEVGFVGYATKAGYCNAALNGVHNSLIVYIK